MTAPLGPQDKPQLVSMAWNHGDPICKAAAEKMLSKAKEGAWLYRCNPPYKQYVVTKKIQNGYETSKRIKINKEDFVQGKIKECKLWDMLLNEQMLRLHPYTHGHSSTQEAELKLKEGSLGSWLFYFCEKENKFAFSVNLGNGATRNIWFSEECKLTTFMTLFEQANKIIKKENRLLMTLNLAEFPQRCRDPKKLEAEVTSLFVTIMEENSAQKAEFKLNGFIKLSRRKYTQLPTSFVIQDLGDSAAKNVNSKYAVKIHQIVHGPGGFLGKGAWKIAKVMQSLNGAEHTVKSKFFNHPPFEVQVQFPEMGKISNLIQGMPYVAEYQCITILNAAYIISKYAKTTLDQLIEQGLTDEDKKRYTLHLLIGLAALHAQKIAHRDIKPDNINIIENSMTHDDEAFLADLDFATMEDRPLQRGSLIYQPLEILKDKNKTIDDLLKADIYAMGMTLYVLYYKKHLWYQPSKYHPTQYGENERFYGKFIMMSEKEILQLFPEPKTDTVDHLIWLMMHPDPLKRPTAKTALMVFQTFRY